MDTTHQIASIRRHRVPPGMAWHVELLGDAPVLAALWASQTEPVR